MHIINILLCTLIALISWCLYLEFTGGHNIFEALTMKFSNISKKSYGIQESLPHADRTPDIIGRLDVFIDKFIAYLDGRNPNDRRVKRLVNRLDKRNNANNSVKIEESPFEPDTSSYTLNKGDLIALCVRNKETKEFHDYQLLLFVVIHELAHVASVSMGHGREFIDTFKWLLGQAAESGMYQPVDYSKAPVTYCGVRVTNNPLLSA